MRALCLLVGLAAVGCGSDGHARPTPAAVSGSVTLDGQPLADGVIAFALPGDLPIEIKIVGGKYAGTANVGTNHVQFAVYRPQGKAKANAGPGADGGVSMENVLPARYSQESKEYREVKAGQNAFDFELKSK
jgi:hypothetical protein